MLAKLQYRQNQGRKLTVLLDQGFGAWRPERNRDFDFRARGESQTRQLRGPDDALWLHFLWDFRRRHSPAGRARHQAITTRGTQGTVSSRVRELRRRH